MIGQTISRYRILAKIGEGAMGEVYQAEHVNLHHRVAIKVLKPSLLRGDEARERFQREAKVAATLDNPALCHVIDVGVHDERAYLVMRYCEGPDLKQVLANHTLPLDRAVLLAIQLAEGLEAAHRQDIVHRDLKPGNIMIAHDEGCAAPPDASTLPVGEAPRPTSSTSPRCQARIVDFGLALVPDSDHLTATGGLVGTPAYMAPEQVRGEAVDHRADLWALGAILHEMLTGRPAFQGTSPAAVLESVLHRPPASLSSARPAVPAKLTWIVSKALRKSADERYQSASEMLVDLRSLYRDLQRGGVKERPTWLVENLRWIRWAGLAVVAVTAVATALMTTGRDGADQPGLPAAQPSPLTSGDCWEGEPALSPDGQRVAYASNRDGQFDIHVVAVTGGQPLRLTRHPASDRKPAWYPDGNTLSFVSSRHGQADIWVTGRFGDGARLLLADADDPAVCPDGRSLAFVREDQAEEGRIFVADLEQLAAPRQLTRGPEHGLWDHREPAWSHDGRRICYGAKNNLWLVDLATGMVRQLTHGGREDRQPAWSADDTHIYFSSFRDNSYAIWRVALGDGRLTRVTQGSGGERHPSLADLGRRLAFHGEPNQDNDLLLVDRRSGHTTRMSGPADDSFPSLATDGSRLVFISDRWSDRNEVWVQDLDAGRPSEPPRQLTRQHGHASHPALSPDGRWVAYYRLDGPERDLWLVPITGGAPHRLTRHPASDVQPGWSPDGRRLAFASNREDCFAVWILELDGGRPGGEPWRLTPPGLVAFRPVWSPDGSQLAFCGDGSLWTMAADGTTEPRCLQRNVGADRARWQADGRHLWVSGLWGDDRYRLRIVPLDGGPAVPIEPLLGPELTEHSLFFDITGDGGILALTQRRTLSRVWLLTATDDRF